MRNIEIIKQLQEKHKNINKQKLNSWIRDLILLEFLRYNDNVEYFDKTFESIILEKKFIEHPLDYALEEAIFITLQPLRNDIDSKSLENTILGWSGQILEQDIGKGKYAKNLIHFFNMSDTSDENVDKLSKEVKEEFEHSSMVPSEEKEKCTKVLFNIVSKIISNPALSDENFYSKLGFIYHRFIRIHPLVDGNGRVSRMLLNYMINQRDSDLPIGFSNADINKLNILRQQASKHLHISFMGNYLSSLKYDDVFADERDIEEEYTADIGRYFKNKQNEVQAKIFKTITEKTL